MSYIATRTSLSPIRRGFAPGFVNYKTGALDWQPQVIKFTSCLPMVGGSLRVLRLLPPLKLVAMILLEVALSTKKIKSIMFLTSHSLLNRITTYLAVITHYIFNTKHISSCTDVLL
jgi:hypothetical protein